MHFLPNPEIKWVSLFVGSFFAAYAYATFLDKKQNYVNFIKLKNKYKDNKEVFTSDYEPFLTYTTPIKYNINGDSKHISGGYWKVARISLLRYNPLKEYPNPDESTIYLTYSEANK